MCQKFSKLLCIFPEAFPFKFLISLSFVPTVITISGNCLWLLSTNAPLEKMLFILDELWVRSNNDKSCKWYFLGNCHTGQIMTAENGGLKKLQPHTHSPVAARLLVFHETLWLFVFKPTTETKRMGIW